MTTRFLFRSLPEYVIEDWVESRTSTRRGGPQPSYSTNNTMSCVVAVFSTGKMVRYLFTCSDVKSFLSGANDNVMEFMARNHGILLGELQRVIV